MGPAAMMCSVLSFYFCFYFCLGSSSSKDRATSLRRRNVLRRFSLEFWYVNIENNWPNECICNFHLSIFIARPFHFLFKWTVLCSCHGSSRFLTLSLFLHSMKPTYFKRVSASLFRLLTQCFRQQMWFALYLHCQVSCYFDTMQAMYCRFFVLGAIFRN